MYNPFSLKNKTILVTGASSGIGKEIAIECSKLGANLIITSRRSSELNDTFSNLNGTNNHQIICDLTDCNQINELVSKLPKLDGIANSAGIVKFIVTKASDFTDVNELFSINTFAPIYLTQSIIKNGKLNKDSSIVYISSISGNKCGYIGGSLYGASKAAIDGFAKSFALEVAHRGIRINTINPGMIDTNLLENTSIGNDALNEDKGHYPLGRYGRPIDVAYASAFLLSDAASWITGSNLIIDGGFTVK